MKCIKCGAQWSLPPGSNPPPDNCPFCQASLTPSPPREITTLEDALREIRAQFGEESFRDSKRVLAIFSDIAPAMKKERLLLSYLFQFGCQSALLDARKRNPSEQQLIFRRTVSRLSDDQFIRQEAAEFVCRSFLTAIGITLPPGQKQPEPAPVKPAPAKPAPTKSAPTKPAPTKPAPTKPAPTKPAPRKILTYATYLQALEELYLQNGKKPVSDAQIQTFLSTHQLTQRFRITAHDVRADLSGIYAKYDPKPVPAPAAPPAVINTYEDYLRELTQLYIRNGKTPLSAEQIQAFLTQYSLERRFGITAFDVRFDLAGIISGIK